jgi:hypothetical protein
MLRGEIVAFDHYHPLGGKTRGQGWNIIVPQKNYLPYFTLLQLLK